MNTSVFSNQTANFPQSGTGVGARIEVLVGLWRERKDEAALGELLKTQRDRAYAIAFRMLGNSADAEDAVQEAFIKLLSRTRGFEDANAFRCSVFRAVMQSASNLARDQRRYRKHKVAAGETKAQPDGVTMMRPQTNASEQTESYQLLREAMSGLPESHRAAVVLCCQQGLKLGEAAEVLEVPRQTLHHRLAKALTSLRRMLDRRGLACSVMVLGEMLAAEADLRAPDSLCSRMDALISGPSCAVVAAEISARFDAAQLPAAAHTLSQTATIWVAACSVLVLSGIGTSVFRGTWNEQKRLAPEASTQRIDERNPMENISLHSRKKGVPNMNKLKMAAVLSGAALVGGSVAQADEPAPVKEIVKKIRAHKAKKAEAAKARSKAVPDGGWFQATNGGGVFGLPGQTIIINEGGEGSDDD